MAKELIHSFTIKPITKKVKRESKAIITIGKSCQAVVFKDNDEYKARLITYPVEDSNEFLILPFTKDSLSLKGKTYVFLKKRDKFNNRICIIREQVKANINPGIPEQYDIMYEGLLMRGHVVKQNDKHYFNYEEILAFSENGVHINDSTVKINK